ncbi:MAG: phosphomethylpyrimidine kinase [Chloroflexi bacterium]|nr:phosphomethylpyrimidine kinase [Chloroflexota bacterium]
MKKKDTAERILGNLAQAVNNLQGCREFSLLMPEVRVNLVYALPGAVSGKQVAAVDGRITVVRGYPFASGSPAWGASDHMARLIIEARKYNADISAGINFKCDSEIIKLVKKYARDNNLVFGWIDRAREPADVSALDGSSMPWKIRQLVSRAGRLPDIFYEGDGWGKEPLFVLLGIDAVSVVKKATDIARKYKRQKAKTG